MTEPGKCAQCGEDLGEDAVIVKGELVHQKCKETYEKKDSCESDVCTTC